MSGHKMHQVRGCQELHCLFHRVIVFANFPSVLQLAIPSLLSTSPHDACSQADRAVEFSVLIGLNNYCWNKELFHVYFTSNDH